MDTLLESLTEFLFKLAEVDKDTKTKEQLLKIAMLLPQSYIPITEEKAQDYIEEEWFKKEAVLNIDHRFMVNSFMYFIPITRLI